MQLLGDKVFVRISKEDRESIFTKQIRQQDGTIVHLFKTIPSFGEMDERNSSLFVQVGTVEEVSPKVTDLFKGDIVFIDYTLCNATEKLVYEDEDGKVYWCNANTTYHKEDLVINANRKHNQKQRDQLVWQKNEIDELSPIIGVLRNDTLIARSPFVFLEHLPTSEEKQLKSGIILLNAKYNKYDIGNKTENIFDRKVLACSKQTFSEYGIDSGDVIKVKNEDIFTIEYHDKKIDAINDCDVLCNLNFAKTKADHAV